MAITDRQALALLIRRRSAVSWQHPLVRLALPAVDSLDRLACRLGTRTDIPMFSQRIRSNGVKGQFGGRRFLEDGRIDLEALVAHGLLTSQSDVLDIGCGVGRLATAFSRLVQHGSYLGIDVDEPSIRACHENVRFGSPHFRFQHVDVETDLYNPAGQLDSRAQALPVASDSADLIVAMSVFTHLYADECANYAAEMLRALRPGGAIVVTAFVLDSNNDGGFSHQLRGSHALTAATPRKAVAQRMADFNRWFDDPELLRGKWHGSGSAKAPRSQDWVIVRR